MQQIIVWAMVIAGMLLAVGVVVWQNRGDARRLRQKELELELMERITKAKEASHAKANEATDRVAASDRDSPLLLPGTVLPPFLRRD